MVSKQYFFTNKASNDLDEILNHFINVSHNFLAAQTFYENVFKTIDRILLFPNSYPVVNNKWINVKDVRKTVIDDYLLYYIYDKEKELITILRIVYSKRDIETILKKL